MKPGTYNRKIIRFNENIRISKTRKTWYCASCHEKIADGKESLIIFNCEPDSNGKFIEQGFGVRFHFRCIGKLSRDLASFRDNKKEYGALHEL